MALLGVPFFLSQFQSSSYLASTACFADVPLCNDLLHWIFPRYQRNSHDTKTQEFTGGVFTFTGQNLSPVSITNLPFSTVIITGWPVLNPRSPSQRPFMVSCVGGLSPSCRPRWDNNANEFLINYLHNAAALEEF